MNRVLDCENYRQFGTEIELNTSDGIVLVLDSSLGEYPKGAEYIAKIVKNTVRRSVKIQKWGINHNNTEWVVKPDASCGIEVCSPVLKGWTGLTSVVKVVKNLRDAGIVADKRCSFHVHVDISSLNIAQLASVIAWYIKCEHVLMDSVPLRRKSNRYCQPIGVSDIFSVNSDINAVDLIEKVSRIKYYGLNSHHFVKGGGFGPHNSCRQTIEFRIAENNACLDPFYVKNWIRLLLHFVEATKSMFLPRSYETGNPWSGLLWLDPVDVIKVLKFDQPMSDGLLQVKQWFLNRILINGAENQKLGLWSAEARSHARSQILSACNELEPIDKTLSENELLFGNKHRK